MTSGGVDPGEVCGWPQTDPACVLSWPITYNDTPTHPGWFISIGGNGFCHSGVDVVWWQNLGSGCHFCFSPEWGY